MEWLKVIRQSTLLFFRKIYTEGYTQQEHFKIYGLFEF